MYSRSRMSGEDRYTENLPPVYNGNRFSYARREHVIHPPAEDHTEEPILPSEAADAVCKEEPAVREECPPTPLPPMGGLLSGIGQEDLILIALLLLLSAEHERAMDIIVILLVLIAIH